MINLKNLAIAAITTAAAIIPSAQASAQQTRLLSADKHNEYGLVYNLPTTCIRFDVTARRTVSKAGPYYQYAKKYIGTDKVIKEDSEHWELISVDASVFGVANTEKQYLMQFKPGAISSVCVDEDGMLLAINKAVDAPQIPEPAVGTELNNKIGVRDYLQFVNEDFLASQSSAKQAQMLSENLMEVRDAKISLTRGTAESMPTDGRQLELMLQSLSKQEASMTAAFIGTVDSQTITRSYIFTPTEAGKFILFRLSDFAGFVEPNDYSGDPVYVSVEIVREGELPVDEKGETKKLPKDAVIYNIPGAANVALSFNGSTMWDKTIDCAQLGVQFGLNPNLFSDKKSRSYATFNPCTGALVKIAEVNGE